VQFNFQIDPRVGQWLNLATFVLSAMLMASWWQDLLTVKEVAVATGLSNLVIATINYVLHGMPPVSLPAPVKAVLAFFAVIILSLVFSLSAHAQTVTKAPVPTVLPTCLLTICEGPYVGGNLVNDGANFDVIGSGLSGLASNGIMMGADAGYEFWNGSIFAAAELDAEYAVTNNMPNVGAGNSAQYALGAQIKLGYSLATLFGAATQGQATPTLPQQLANSLISPYIAVGVWDRPWGPGLATGAGVQALIATNWTLDAEYLHVTYNNAAINPIVNEQTENLFMLALNRHF
jgi:opacity protein-like surface antigen